MKNDRNTSDSYTSNTTSTNIGMENTYTSSVVDTTEHHSSWNHHHTTSSPNNNDTSIKPYHSSIGNSGGNRSVDSEKRMLRSMPYSSYEHNTTTVKAFSYASLAENPPPIFGNTNSSSSSSNTAIISTTSDVNTNTATLPSTTTTTPNTTNYYAPKWNTKSSFEQSASYKKHSVHDNEPQDFSSFKWKRMKHEDDTNTNSYYTSNKSNTSTPNNNLTKYNSTTMLGESSTVEKNETIQQHQQAQQQQQQPGPSHKPYYISSNKDPEITQLSSPQPTVVAIKVESTKLNELILPLSNVVREGIEETTDKSSSEVIKVSETIYPSVDQTVGQDILKSEKVLETARPEQELKGSITTIVGQSKSPLLEKTQETTSQEPIRKATTAPASTTNAGAPIKSEKVQDTVTSQEPVRKGTMAFLRYMDALNTLEYTYVKYVLACKQEKKLQLHIQQLEKESFTT